MPISTTFRQDLEAMAARAVALLDLRQREPELAPIRERLSVPLVVRGSFVPSSDAQQHFE